MWLAEIWQRCKWEETWTLEEAKAPSASGQRYRADLLIIDVGRSLSKGFIGVRNWYAFGC